jgi:FeS assembly SUF system protein
MKTLPVIQPVPASLPSQTRESETAGLTNDEDRAAALRPLIVAALSRVFDPEIPVNIYELGLIYDIVIDRAGVVGIRMTLTAPGCPAAQVLPLEVRKQIAEIPEVTDVKVDVVWDPPWDRDRMSDTAKLQLGLF